MSLLRRTWGEALIGRLGLGFFLFLLFIPVLLLFVAGVFALTSNAVPVGIALLVVGFIGLLLHSAISSACTPSCSRRSTNTLRTTRCQKPLTATPSSTPSSRRPRDRNRSAAGFIPAARFSIPRFQPQNQPLHPEVRVVEEAARAIETREPTTRVQGRDLRWIDRPIDLIARTHRVTEIEEVVTDEEAPASPSLMPTLKMPSGTTANAVCVIRPMLVGKANTPPGACCAEMPPRTGV